MKHDLRTRERGKPGKGKMILPKKRLRLETLTGTFYSNLRSQKTAEQL